MSDVNYGVDPTIFMQRYEASQARKIGGHRGWKLEQGPPGKAKRSVIRMMPGHENVPGRDPIIETKVHFNLGPQRNTACPCLEFYGKACPACLWVDELYARARRADPDEAKKIKDFAYDMRAKWRFGCQMVDMGQPQNGVQEFWFSDELEKKLRSCFLDDNVPPQYRDICHPMTGRNIILEVSTKPNTEWPSFDVVRAAESQTTLPDMDWLKDIKDMTFEHVYEPSLEQVQGALQGNRIQRPGQQQGRAGAIKPAIQQQAQLPAAQTVIPTTATVLPTPAPAAETVAIPAGRGRGGKGATAGAPAPVPTPAAATAGVPTPAAATPAPGGKPPRPPRQPVGATATAPAPNGYQAAYDAAKSEIVKIFGSPREITEAELQQQPKPPCFTSETDPTDPACQQCSVIIPCLAAKMGWLKFAAA
jgi:hypothetical protein